MNIHVEYREQLIAAAQLSVEIGQTPRYDRRDEHTVALLATDDIETETLIWPLSEKYLARLLDKTIQHTIIIIT